MTVHAEVPLEKDPLTDVTMTLAKWATNLQLGDVPTPVLERTRLLFLDYIGIAMRGRSDSESSPAMVAAIKDIGSRGPFRVIGDPDRYSALSAALLEGSSAHSIEYDDFHMEAHTHNAPAVMPAALIAGQMANATGNDLLAALVAGVEANCRVGRAAWTPALHQRGFYMSPLAGTFGATFAACRAMSLNVEQTNNALGIALNETAGSGQFRFNGSWAKRFQLGHAAMSGVLAASLARRGYSGADHALEGERGFFQLYSDAPRPEMAVIELGSRWEIENIAFKPHSSCRTIHPFVDAAIAAHHRYGLAIGDIADVTVHMEELSYHGVGLPRERVRAPQTVLEAQFSVHFGIAVALHVGRQHWDDYREFLQHPGIRALMLRTEAIADAEKALDPRRPSGSITIRTADNRCFTEFITVAKGEPTNMMTTEEVVAKFVSLSSALIGTSRSEELREWALAVDRQDVVESLYELTLPVGPAT